MNLIRRRRLGVAVAALSALWLLNCWSESPREEAFRRIHSGMTRDEVAAIIGQPLTTYAQPFPSSVPRTCPEWSRAVEVYVYSQRSDLRSFIFFDERGTVVCHTYELSPIT
jgi:hypothetical protein